MPPKQTVIDIDEDKLKTILEKVEARTPTKPKQGMALREVITKSKPMINKALKRGYTYEEIAAILTDEGISIKGATLKQYLTESKSKKCKTASTTSPKQIQQLKQTKNQFKQIPNQRLKQIPNQRLKHRVNLNRLFEVSLLRFPVIMSFSR